MPTNYVKSWFARGDDDLILVKVILERGTGAPNLACFHAQQATEKYLKGFLAHHDLHVRKVHDLEILLEDCKKVDSSFGELQADAVFLNRFYSESRYPDDYVEFSREDAEGAHKAALRVKEFVLDKIRPDSNSGFISPKILIGLALAVILGGWYFVYYRQPPLLCTDGNRECTADIHTLCSPDGKERKDVASSCSCGEDANSLEAKGWKACKDQKIQQPSQPDTTSWKTYRNEQYRFEVRYPPTFSNEEIELVHGIRGSDALIVGRGKVKYSSLGAMDLALILLPVKQDFYTKNFYTSKPYERVPIRSVDDWIYGKLYFPAVGHGSNKMTCSKQRFAGFDGAVCDGFRPTVTSVESDAGSHGHLYQTYFLMTPQGGFEGIAEILNNVETTELREEFFNLALKVVSTFKFIK